MDNLFWDIFNDTSDSTSLELDLNTDHIQYEANHEFDADWWDFSDFEAWARYLPSFDSGGEVAGDPQEDREWWNYQGNENSCAIIAQQGVVESIIGHDLSSEKLISFSTEQGWYDPEMGTAPADIGNILNEFDIPYHSGHGNDFSDIYNALESGQKVIVGLDANEIWNPGQTVNGDPLEQQDAGHAVWVTGIAEHDGEVFVVINDSAPKDGWQNEVALKDFLNAWDDFGNFAVITEIDQTNPNLSTTKQYNAIA